MEDIIPLPSHSRFVDLTGQKFGRLTVVAYAGKHGAYPKWRCVCVCGGTKTTRSGHLKSGRASSCGCYNAELQRKSFQTHGGATFDKSKRHPLYSIWCGMKKRCYSPRCQAYPYYGGRGITVCDEWRTDFKRFADDMGSRPSAEHSIERRENDGPYAPWNCRWATKSDQMKNRRKWTIKKAA